MTESGSILRVRTPRCFLLRMAPAPSSGECGVWSPAGSLGVPGPQGGPGGKFPALGNAPRVFPQALLVFRIPPPTPYSAFSGAAAPTFQRPKW